MIAIIFRTFTRDKQSFSPSGGWTKWSPPRGNNPCQLGDVRWQRHLLDLPMASYFCQVALIMLMMVVVRILMIVMKTMTFPAYPTSQYGWPSTPRPRPSRKDQKPISEPCLRTPLKSIITIIVLTVNNMWRGRDRCRQVVQGTFQIVESVLPSQVMEKPHIFFYLDKND